MKIECPLCEHLIGLAGPDVPDQVECPLCAHVWAPQEPTGEPASELDQDSAGPPPVNRRDSESPSPAILETRQPAPAKPVDPLLDVYLRKRRRQRIVQASVLAVLAVATTIAILIVTLNHESQKKRRASEPNRSAEPAARDPGVADPTASSATESGKSNDSGPLSQTQPPSPLGDRPPPRLPEIEFTRPPRRLLTQAKLEQAWRRLQPHLVELEADTPFGTRRVPGLIVDSRGWVVTSYRAVKDANKITARSIPQSDDVKPLEDRVRGWLAADPAHDLVLLQVNRRFVTSLRDPPLAMEDKVVSSQHLIHVTIPGEAFPWAANECRVDRKRLADLAEPTQKQLAAGGMDDPDFEWITHSVHCPNEGGSLIVDTAGVIQAMNIQLHAAPVNQHESLAVPALWIHELKPAAAGDPRPLPVASSNGLANGELPASLDPDDRPDSSIPVAAPESEFRDLSISLNRLGRQCESLGWWPDSDAAAERLAEFIRALSEVRGSAEDPATREEEAATLQAQSDYWWNRVSTELTPPESLDNPGAEFNRRMASQWNHPGPFLAVTSIKLAAIISPPIPIETETADESVTFEGIDNGMIWIANTRQGWPVLRPETRWLVWGVERRGQFMLQTENGDGADRLRPAVIFGLAAPEWVK